MARLRPDLRILIIALAVLIIAGVIIGLTSPPPPAPPLSVRSDAANGAMLLRLWLQEVGYETREMVTQPMRLDTINALFILDPILMYDSGEIALIVDWVRRGNTLIVTGAPFYVNDLLRPFRASLRYLARVIPDDDVLSPASPVLKAPPVDRVRAEPELTVGSIEVRQRDDAVVHLAVSNQPVVVSFREGRGTVWISGAFRPFTNRGLGSDGGSARLILNMLAGLPHRAVIGFDEVRHGFTDQPLTLSGWLFETPPGWGVIIGGTLVGVFLGLRGRRFGQVVPLPGSTLRREPVEYIQAMAALFRRSGQRADTLRHYEAQFRRRLSERFGVDPRLSPDDLARAVASRDQTVDTDALRDLLAQLARAKVSEGELVRIAAEVDQVSEKIM